MHPARLARELRRAALTAGVSIFENTPMIGVDRGAPNRVRTPNGQIVARDVVLATNIALAKMSEVMRYVSVFSSYAVMTEPQPSGWKPWAGPAMRGWRTCGCSSTTSVRPAMGAC